MKDQLFTIVMSIAAGILTGVLLLLRATLGSSGSVRLVAYVAVPLFLGLILVLRSVKRGEFLLQLTLATVVYALVVTLSEPIAYRSWVEYTTPLGNTYSSYNLHAIYPVPGALILPGAFALSLLLLFLWTAIRKTTRAVDRRVQSIKTNS